MGAIDSDKLLELVDIVVDKYTIYDNVSKNKSIPVKLLKKIIEKLESEETDKIEIKVESINYGIISHTYGRGKAKLYDVIKYKEQKGIMPLRVTSRQAIFTNGEIYTIITRSEQLRGRRFNKVYIDSMYKYPERFYNALDLHFIKGEK